jgi:hypothetical protein
MSEPGVLSVNLAHDLAGGKQRPEHFGGCFSRW